MPGVSALRQSSLIEHCPLRGVPKCLPASKRYRTHDGTCNNLNRPRWGSTMTSVQRFLEPSYSDGIQAPRRSVTGQPLPSAREISSLVHEDRNVQASGITHLLMQWGQFLDHDVTSSSQSRGFNGSVPRCCRDGGREFMPRDLMHPECMPIPVPPSDPFYGPRGVKCLDFLRSSPAPREDCSLGWREQINQVSAYIDGSPIYGSSARQSDRLRLFRNGMLQYGRVQDRRPILPADRKEELCRGGAVSTDCFKSGDGRVNEQPGLVAAHIMWLRLHNRLAQELAHQNAHWSDEKIYQETRKIIGAMVQHITYKEFLPIVLGSEVMRLFEVELNQKGYYKGYNPKINASPASSFSSAAFRFGHSLVQPSMMRYDRFHRPLNNNVSLHNELSNPANIWSMGAVDRLILGMVNQPIQKRDEFITEELTNHLFQTPKFDFGMDLAAINIQRGRDHGVPAYTSWREPCGLTPIIDFQDLFRIMPTRAVRKLQTLYKNVDDIDLFTGGMAERPVVGGLVGPTFACIIAQQFSNLRKGDRFWYENGGLDSSFTPAQLQQIRRISLSQVICRTLDNVENLQPFAFLSADVGNERLSCQNSLLNNFDISAWVELDNDISKSDVVPLKEPPTNPTTQPPKTTTKQPAKTTTAKQKQEQTTVKSATKKKPQGIDDKLDFKNKTKRFEDDRAQVQVQERLKYRPSYAEDYDYEEQEEQHVQSVVVSNLPHKRPSHNRPVISVTENVNRFTYLINYVPRPTQSWRRTTKTPLNEDVVKVTYQNYGDTYRRPYRPNKYDRPDFDDRYRLADKTTDPDGLHSSARSNDATLSEPNVATTDNYKLVTFRYVGTYKGHAFEQTKDTTTIRSDSTTKLDNKTKLDSKTRLDSSTTNNKDNRPMKDKTEDKKLTTFYHYDTSTQPYKHRPTKRHDSTDTNKYYYIRNVLHKYPSNETDTSKLVRIKEQDFQKFEGQERSTADKMPIFAEETPKVATAKRNNVKPKPGAAKTPTVTFQVIPSENSPGLWAVYEENHNLPEGQTHVMPPILSDPYASKELPRPMNLSSMNRKPFKV